ncbi:unnamed protein product [Mytilus coruscus]|uniref:Uncharacterized protein n=1 Tax=Mytilus coruscus TaxID=42192 RepID=A0A6J8C9Y2_MYTCO|nr:unnamed protein product [Mytilus coruscus]
MDFKHSNGKQFHLEIAKNKNDNICAVTALTSYSTLRTNTTGPLFLNSSGEAVSRQLFQHALNGALNFCWLSIAYYKPHSVRIGFATDASAKGLSTETVRTLGGTVVVTAHHKINMDNLEELSRASGGACGGTTVDKEFLNLFECIVGKKVMKFVQKEHTAGYIDLMRDFETIKRKTNSTPDHDHTDYVDDEGCEKLVEFSVSIQDPSGKRRYVDVEFKFGMVKLDVTATERQTGKKTLHYSLI